MCKTDFNLKQPMLDLHRHDVNEFQQKRSFGIAGRAAPIDGHVRVRLGCVSTANACCLPHKPTYAPYPITHSFDFRNNTRLVFSVQEATVDGQNFATTGTNALCKQALPHKQPHTPNPPPPQDQCCHASQQYDGCCCEHFVRSDASPRSTNIGFGGAGVVTSWAMSDVSLLEQHR